MTSVESGMRPATRSQSTTTATIGRLNRAAALIDLLLITVVVLIAAVTTLIEAPAEVRIPLGILLVLFLPGYAIVAALFPNNDGPDGVARVAFSVALSLAMIPPLVLAIDRLSWRIERVSVTVGLLIVTVIAIVGAAILRLRLPPVERYVVTVRRPAVPSPSNWSRERRLVALALGLGAVLFIVGGYDAVKTQLTGEPLTEFAIYNAAGEAQFYPRVITVGEPTTVRIGITNHENTSVTYELVIAGAGTALEPLPEITLADGEIWQGSVHFTVTTSGVDLPIRFELYRDDHSTAAEPYRLLQLIVDGQSPETLSP